MLPPAFSQSRRQEQPVIDAFMAVALQILFYRKLLSTLTVKAGGTEGAGNPESPPTASPLEGSVCCSGF